MDEFELRGRLERIEEGLVKAVNATEDVAQALQEHRLNAAGMVGDLRTQLATLTANVSQVVNALPPIIRSSGESAGALKDAVAEMRQARSTYEWGPGMKAARADDGRLPKWAQYAALVLLAIVAALVGVKEVLPELSKMVTP